MLSVYAHFLSATVALGLASYSCVSSGATSESTSVPITLDEQLTQLDRAWRAGEGKREYEYYVRAGSFAEGLVAEDPVAANAAAAKVLNSILAKKAGSTDAREADFEVGAADLFAMAKLSRFLLGNEGASMEQRLQNVQLLARVLGRVRTEIVRDYVPKDVFMNVMPPAGVRGMAGMRPEAISDPVAREKYKAAILQNRLNNLMNKRQERLHEMDQSLAEPIVGYMGRVAATDDTAHGIVLQAIIAARLTAKERADVMRALPH